MGYKTKDPVEVTRLQAQGYSVIGMSPEKLETDNTLPRLIYEFNFDSKEVLTEKEVKVDTIPLQEDNILKKEVKKRGRPKREVNK